MKRNIYTFIVLILLGTSCRSVEKMVDRGDYDGAIVFAVKKLSGKKNKKTKYVLALEEAFQKITHRDMEQINRLNDPNKPENLDRIVKLYKRIDNRQERIRPFLPLVSKDGHKAVFSFVNVGPLIHDAKHMAADYHYNRATDLLSLAKHHGVKDDARSAYNAIVKVESYYMNYKKSESIKREALDLGQDRILVKVENESNSILPKGFERELLNLDLSHLNSKWSSYYMNTPLNRQIDYVSSLKIRHLDISPEREIIKHFVEEKEIQDGWDYVLDSNGNVMKDTLGNDIKIDRFVTIRANVVEIHREKIANVRGLFETRDLNNRQILKTIPVQVDARFEDYASSIRGDKRAVCDRTRRRIKSTPLNFPSDFELIWESVEELKTAFKSSLRKVYI